MALQTKTFSLGSFTWKDPVSNGYILELIITEEETDLSQNISRLTYQLQLRSGSNNRFTGYLGAEICLGGTQVAQKAQIGMDPYYNHTYSLLSGSTAMKHGSDGSLLLEVTARIWQESANSYAPPAMEISGTMELTRIPRVSVPTASPSPVAPGGKLTIRTNRKSDAFTHILSYQFGEASGVIAENVSDVYEWQVPEALAALIPNDTTGWGEIRCVTVYGGEPLGEDKTDLVITVPQNDITRPVLNPQLLPVNEGLPDQFADLYIQGKSRLQVHTNAAAWYSQIANCTMQVQGLTYSGSDPIRTDILLQSGACEVVCSATDGRGYEGKVSQSITILPYKKPSVVACSGLEDIICCRSDAEGNPSRKGTRLLIKAQRAWYALGGRNACTIQWRYRESGAAWQDHWQILLAADAQSDEVTVVADVLLEIKQTYQVQLRAIDTVGESSTLTMPIGTANTPLHLGRGGRNLGLGRYCDYTHEDAIDVGWPMYLHESINGLYLGSCVINGPTFTLQTRFAQFLADGNGWQSMQIWGCCGGVPVYGTVGVSEKGETVWSGTEGVQVAAGVEGRVIVTVPQADGDQLIVMSTDRITIL